MSNRLKCLSGIVSYSYLQIADFLPSFAVWSGIDKADNLLAKRQCAEFGLYSIIRAGQASAHL